MPYLSFDLETALSVRAQIAPAIACGAWAEMSDEGEIKAAAIGLRPQALAEFKRQLASGAVLVNQFYPYDIACLLEDATALEGGIAAEVSGKFGSVPRLSVEIWNALRAGRFVGVDICQMLLDVAAGKLEYRELVKEPYNLTNIAAWNGIEVPPKEETWRLYYSQLAEIEPEIWPEAARAYVLQDADLPLRIHRNQLAEDRRWVESYGHPVLHEAGQQTWAQTCLHLTAGHGVRSSEARVTKLRAEVEAHISALKVKLIAAGLVRPIGSKDTKKAKALVKATFEAQGRPVPMTVEKKNRKAKTPFVPQVSTEEDTMVLSGHPLLIDYSDFASSSILLDRVEDLAEGYVLPLQCEFTSIRATGRTSSRKPRSPHKGTQQQNWPREVGARESLIPRDGCAFLWADFEAAEMHTLAQNCKDEVGYSKLGELLNSGVDPHAWFAGLARLGLTGLTDKQMADVVMGREDKKELRGWSKPNNFGRPGGQGDASFVTFSRKQYGVLFTLSEAKHYGQLWFRALPEVKELHGVVKRLLGRNDTCTVRIRRGGFVAGGKRFTAACNFFFQAPCAAGAKASLCHVMYECYADPDSPLFGFRVWNMVHDEICLEGPIGRVHEAGVRLREIMEREFNVYTPDYPTGVEVIAGNAWSKDAKPVYDASGRLGLWIYEDYLAEKANKERARAQKVAA